MTDLHTVLLLVGALVLGLGAISGFVHDRLPVSVPMLAFAAGLVLGPVALDVLDPRSWMAGDTLLREVSRLTLAIGLMATALRLPPRYFQEQWRTQARLIGLLMPAMWGVSALLAYAWLDVRPAVALLIGAIVTPTDPIVASSIVTSALAKQSLPDRVRHALSGESGANDGLATTFVGLAILLLTVPPGAALGGWFTDVLLQEVGGGILLGLVLGAAAGLLLTWSERHEFLEESSFLAFTVALALLVIGTAGLLGVNGVLAVFVAGLGFDNMVGGRERAEEAQVQEAVNQFFTLPVFALFGLLAPVADWLALGWRGVGLALMILALRRLPAVLMLGQGLPAFRGRGDALFVGWFGPIGVSALLYVTHALHRTGQESLWPVVSLIVAASIVAHGITATPFTRLYGGRPKTA